MSLVLYHALLLLLVLNLLLSLLVI